MADTAEGDNIVYFLDLLVPALMSLTVGLVIHSFIIGVNINDWWKRRPLTPVDHIVTSLGISRMCTQIVDTISLFDNILSLRNLSSVSPIILDTDYFFSAYANMWLTSLLSIVLCLKISSLHTRLFLYLRRMILHRTVLVFVASVLFLGLIILMTLLFPIIEIADSGTHNTTMDDLSINCIYINYVYNITIECFFPLFFYSISSILLFTSLYYHTTRMKMSSNLSINLETYYSAMRFISISFIYNTMYLMGQFAFGFYYYYYCLTIEWLYIVLGLLPSLHSSYLIYRTDKLRNQMSKILNNLICFLCHRKDTETRENIEMVAQ